MKIRFEYTKTVSMYNKIGFYIYTQLVFYMTIGSHLTKRIIAKHDATMNTTEQITRSERRQIETCSVSGRAIPLGMQHV